ncbi:hypothetical protein [Paenibacillus woosongensis]|uniref:Uncharacterized protein n=1 Tax=Paenibacillus woosongensis TaxID=307580 RepID=A0ABQ4MPK0_9BACL|nr:hypothetical protein [Paenibacillus woosongensis]GIP57884.1 hypothetical protein J15TS10_16980 [Paenibacillus woosongensis]
MGYKFATVKIADIDTLLNDEERNQLYRLLNLITDRRVENGKKYNRYLVINQDEQYAPAVLNLMKQQGHWENSDLELHPKKPYWRSLRYGPSECSK